MGGISIITARPDFVTQEQHQELTSSTPASFADLPTAVLYHQQQDVSITLDPPLQGFETQDCANGTLYILSSCVINHPFVFHFCILS
jgi:chloride channel, nucleotide-sensitive, 1A